VPYSDAIGIGIGLEQDSDLLSRAEQGPELDHAAQVREVGELIVDVVADE